MKDKKNRAGQNGERCESLRESIAPHFARKSACQPYQGSAGQRGQKSKAKEGITEDMPREPGDHSNERRLIDITPIEMF